MTVISTIVPSERPIQDTHYKDKLSFFYEEQIRLKQAVLTFEDGTSYKGTSFGAEISQAGEVVFNTGMVGYPESLTDPSYSGQILVLTYPLIGNYGVPNDQETDEFGLLKYFESSKIHIKGLIVCDYSFENSHYESRMPLSSWLKKHNIPALFGIDTRELTKKIRVKGSLLGKIEFRNEKIEFYDPNKINLVAGVSRKEVTYIGSPGDPIIIVVDCGIKNNIIRFLAKNNVQLKIVPWDYDYSEEEYDGVFLSNGPGNPETVKSTIETLKKVMELRPNCPIFGICLGHQILALAAGATTYKMKFGNRGMNQPVIDLRTMKCYITPQNHGFAVDARSLKNNWTPFFVNANDHSNEGIIHINRPWSSVQFHPEAMGGPTDTAFLFDIFFEKILDDGVQYVTTIAFVPRPDVSKVLLVGSGGLSIGQAGEFDYSGSQAIKALKEENLETILINPNIATVQTSAEMADTVYFLPITPHFVEKIIEKEKPDGILLQFGGQTALNCGIELTKQGVFERYNVQVLGTPVATIEATEDRKLFAEKLAEINEKVAPSAIAVTLDEAMKVASEIGYPVLVRSAFALGGLGSGFAENEDEMRSLVKKALANSPQIIIDKSLRGWKEVEYEVVRDSKDNCVTVCNMENFDPLGIHTGDSIVVAPSQTLTNFEYFKLRKAAIKIIRHLRVVGECNIQYALDPHSDEYCVIEVNARLSRSSALASKATGYPLAYVAAKLALGITLPNIKNSVTQTTCACFEPSLDYCVVKIPRWDMRKFEGVSTYIGSAMKSVGEVMAIDRKFEAAFSKAIRMMDPSLDGFGDIPLLFQEMTTQELEHAMTNPDDKRILAIAAAMNRNLSVDQIYEYTKIDRWFLHKLLNIINLQKLLRRKKLTDIDEDLLLHAKRCGFSDRQIGRCVSSSELQVRKRRQNLKILPFVKQIDTLAAEFPARTNYLYMTYSGSAHDLTFLDHGIMVLGCGAYRIGSSCEFDWCAVSAARTLRLKGVKSIVVNYNPETVSTDYDECDRLYFEELSFERVLDIYELEKSKGIIVSVGGQIPNNIAMPLFDQGVCILGTQPTSIDNAEDRFRFSEMLDRLGIDQPRWKQLTSVQEASKFAQSVGYPVLVRPSYVLSGAAMNVAVNEQQLTRFLRQATQLNSKHPVVISKFITGAKEIEVDAVASKGNVINYAISEHVENAGVHSGDATLVLPAQNLYVETMKRVRKTTLKISKALNITGPFNIQYLCKDNDIKVIECNLRASRSFPFVSKTLNVNLIDLATRAMLGEDVRSVRFSLFDFDYVCVKVPMFSFTRLVGADPILRVEMASTGEVACFGETKYEAYLKALIASGFKMPTGPRKSILISAGPLKSKIAFLESAKILRKLGFTIYATTKTQIVLSSHGVEAIHVFKPSEKNTPSVIDFLSNGKIDLVVNVPENLTRKAITDGYKIRRTTVDYGIPLFTNIQNARLLVSSLERVKVDEAVRPWKSYLTTAFRA
jgi:carbamoyl-phosphate synthase large subunit/carbamoyl-phosphate synthase small subunit